MGRAVLLVMDSLGIGNAPDAASYGDAGADTFGHILAAAAGRADRAGLRRGPLQLPHLENLGLHRAAGLDGAGAARGLWGSAEEVSRGKDTPSGHWEIAGVPVSFDWGRFPPAEPCFPPALIEALRDDTGIPGILGDRHASGTAIIEEFGEESIRTGRPIVYTSADSVIQIAAHETRFGLDRLLFLPTWPGSDHTRERVPVLAFGPGIAARHVGVRPSFADIGESVAAHLGLAPGRHGSSFL